MIMKIAAALTAACAILCGAGSDVAEAVEIAPDPTRHWRPGAKSRDAGVRLGSFLTYVSAGVSTTYTDNLFARDQARAADVIVALRGAARIETDWRSHGLGVNAKAVEKTHLTFSSENTLDYRLGVDGFLDLLPGTRVGGAASYAREHEGRASPNEAGGAEPTPVGYVAAQLGAEQKIGALGLEFAASYEELDFEDTRLLGVREINNDDRDRTVRGGQARVIHGAGSRLRPFVSASYAQTDYAAERDDNGFDRDSDAIEGAVGVELELGSDSIGEIAVGYRRQDFADKELGTVSGMTIEGRLDARLAGATHADLTVGRTLRETTVVGAAGFFETAADARLRHRLSDMLRLHLTGGIARNDFRGTDREDTVYHAGLGVAYVVNRHARLQLRYGFTRRNSNADADFTLNRFTTDVRLRF